MAREVEGEPIKVEVQPASDLAGVQSNVEWDRQIATAKAYPRSLAEFKRRVMEMATLDKETAESCWYAIPRQGKVIEGPGIRFAEIVMSSFGNLRVASRTVDTLDKFVTVQAVAFDLERNVAVQRDIKRRITDRNGNRYSDDMIGVTAMAAQSIALRNAVFSVVPKALYKNILDEVKKVAMGDERTLKETRASILAYFKKLKVDEKALLKFLSQMTEVDHKGVEDINLADATLLRGVANAIRDEGLTVTDAFNQQLPVKAAIPATAIKAADPKTHTGPSKKLELPPEEEMPEDIEEADGSE